MLRACRERPRDCRAAEQRDELASPHIGSEAHAETGTLIGTETIGAVHSQCPGWVINDQADTKRTAILAA
jgi:hypothetical protein